MPSWLWVQCHNYYCTISHWLAKICMSNANQMPSVLWRCWLGGRKGIRPVKTQWWGVGVVICLERGVDLHRPPMAQLMPLPFTVSCFSKIQIGLTFLVPAHPGSPGKMAIKLVCGVWMQTSYVSSNSVWAQVFSFLSVAFLHDTNQQLSALVAIVVLLFVVFSLAAEMVMWCVVNVFDLGWMVRIM